MPAKINLELSGYWPASGVLRLNFKGIGQDDEREKKRKRERERKRKRERRRKEKGKGRDLGATAGLKFWKGAATRGETQPFSIINSRVSDPQNGWKHCQKWCKLI